MKTPRTQKSFRKAEKTLTIADYRKADSETTQLFLDALDQLKTGSCVNDAKLVWSVGYSIVPLFMTIDRHALPDRNFESLPSAARLMLKTVFQNAAKINTCYGQRGGVQTSLYVSSLVDATAAYFETIPKFGKKRAFLTFKRVLEYCFESRMVLLNYSNRYGGYNTELARKLLRRLEWVGARKHALQAKDLGDLVMAIELNCGVHSSQQDKRDLALLRKTVADSQSMPEFLMGFTAGLFAQGSLEFQKAA